MFSHLPFAYVSFTDGTFPYPALTSFLLHSHQRFSQLPLILYTHNVDIRDYYDNSMNQIHIVPLESSLSFASPYFYKSYVIHDVLSKGLNAGYYVESDDMLVPGCDRITSWLPTLDTLPLCPIHENRVVLPQDYLQRFGVTAATQPYVHGHVLFDKRHKTFIAEWHEESKRVHGENWDESVLNVLLWKYGAKDYYLPVIDPYWINNTYTEINDILFRDPGIVTYHGYKRIDEAARTWEFMQEAEQRVLEQAKTLHHARRDAV